MEAGRRGKITNRAGLTAWVAEERPEGEQAAEAALRGVPGILWGSLAERRGVSSNSDYKNHRGFRLSG